MLFDRVAPDSANEVLRGWRRDERYQAAVEELAAARTAANAG